jgi:hypothetical protein
MDIKNVITRARANAALEGKFSGKSDAFARGYLTGSLYFTAQDLIFGRHEEALIDAIAALLRLEDPRAEWLIEMLEAEAPAKVPAAEGDSNAA